PTGEYYIQAFKTGLMVNFNRYSNMLYLTRSYGFKFNFEHQADGSYLIYANISISTNRSMYVNRTSMNIQLPVSSSSVINTYYYLEYQPTGSFKLKVKSLDYYITRSDLLLTLTKETYGDDGKFLIETTRPAWDIIFRIPTGSPYNIYQAFLHGEQQLMTNSCEVNTDDTCKYSFTRKDDILKAWWNGCLSICKIKYSLTQNNEDVIAFVFDGVNTSPVTWFVEEKLQRCIYYTNIIANYSLTAAEPGDWFFKVTDKLTHTNIFSIHYENQANPPDRRLTAVLLHVRVPAAEVQISVTTN
ncbi:hypothetical protein ACJMK2_039507, partial [Sinanodonta woodiana]